MGNVSLAPQFIRYTVNCTSRDSASHLITHLVVYIIARCSSLDTTIFFLSSALSSHIPQETRYIINCAHLSRDDGFLSDGGTDAGPFVNLEREHVSPIR
jgi:hypothetical protein